MPLEAADPSLDGWRLQRQTHGLTVEWTPVARASICLGTARTTAAASTLARRLLCDPRVAFERHSWLDAPYALWVGVAAPTSTAARAFLARDRGSQCATEQEARARRWTRADGTIADSLASVGWLQLMQTPGAPASHRLLFHKLKGDRLTGWDRLHARRGCPHCPAIGGDGGSAFHLAWGCRHASARWEQLRDLWTPLYERLPRLHDGGLKADIFSLRLAVLPDALWSHPELMRLGAPTTHDTIATTLALQSVWRRHVLVTLSEIWKRRTAPDTCDDQWTDQEARARHGASLHAVLHGLRWERAPNSAATKFTAAALDVLYGSQGPPAQPAPAPSQSPTDSYVLFFDGGPRGNPGPGGAGAVIIRVDGGRTRASVIWSAAMSLRDARTTNNQAEYQGLLSGLKAAHRHAWEPLEVVGDSQLILRQMEQYRPPKNSRLLQCYAEARRVADTLRVRSWRHHYRACNKMADAAANAAMDAGASSQVFHPTMRPEHATIAAFLPSDFAQWQVAHFS